MNEVWTFVKLLAIGVVVSLAVLGWSTIYKDYKRFSARHVVQEQEELTPKPPGRTYF